LLGLKSSQPIARANIHLNKFDLDQGYSSKPTSLAAAQRQASHADISATNNRQYRVCLHRWRRFCLSTTLDTLGVRIPICRIGVYGS
jgi:hypothetical protein